MNIGGDEVLLFDVVRLCMVELLRFLLYVFVVIEVEDWVEMC